MACFVCGAGKNKQQPFGYCFSWSRRQDSNLRHLAPKASALPNCATPRYYLHFEKVSAVLFFLLCPKQAYSCGSQNSLRLVAPMNFDRCAILALLHRPQDALRQRCYKTAPRLDKTYIIFAPFFNARTVYTIVLVLSRFCFVQITMFLECIFLFRNLLSLKDVIL